MTAYLVQRLLSAALVLWLISVAVFIFMRLAPSNPAVVSGGLISTPEAVAAREHEMGLDRSYVAQYLIWVKHLGTADPGRSAITFTSVSGEFRSRMPVTIQLMVMTMFWIVLIGVPLGIVSAMGRNSLGDYAARLFAVIGLAVPGFWLATLVLLIPLRLWGYAPPLGGQTSPFTSPIENLQQFGPASLVLAFASIATVMRLTRSALLEVMATDYIRTARAKGLSESTVVFRHALKNSSLPILTILGLVVGNLLGGSVIIESIFNLRGFGQYIYQALIQQDFNVAQTLVLYTAGASIMLNLIVDLLYGVLDPKIRGRVASNG